MFLFSNITGCRYLKYWYLEVCSVTVEVSLLVSLAGLAFCPLEDKQNLHMMKRVHGAHDIGYRTSL